MSKTWKWILGIVAVLLVVTFLATPFLLRSALPASAANRPLVQPRAWDGFKSNGRPFNDWNRHPARVPFSRDYLPFGGLFRGLGMLLSLVLPAAVLFGIIYGAVRLALKNSQTILPPAVAPLLTHPCPKCGFAVQTGWKHCPACGAEQ
ncbi:MAG: hypothetical protein ACUVRJ_10020 [Candidatus Villigracilaceae bacterium]